MKKKVLITLSIVFLFALSSPQIALARAGGGHGGGHGGGGSSSGGSFHSGGSGGHIGRYGGISTLVIASSYGIIYLFLKRKRKYGQLLPSSRIKFESKNTSSVESKFWSNEKLFQRIVECHRQIQFAWSEMAASYADGFMTKDLMEYHQGLLDKMKEKHLRNIVKNVKVISIEAHSVNFDADPPYFLAKITAKMIDYEINETTNHVTIGSKVIPEVSTETWSFKKIDGKWCADWIYG
ncbi:TIM44-like domain-containing protein [Clostridium tyrobutyricum]|uniref:TIM44-like domain-containing protein n=1 Tax=Clostridium tyrobutyricum TaxID=1519 RepID=UPI0011C7D08F|nr:TIM44-like domain-containing protein [Clostridium tyrobutyricum]